MKKTVIGALMLAFSMATAHAQEDAPQDGTTSPSKENAVLEARLADMAAQLATCQNDMQDARDAVQKAVDSVPTNLPQPASAHTPPSRSGGGFRMAPEPRLGCDDYSESYFERHPSMARVCGRQVGEKALPQPSLLPTAEE